MIHLRIVSATCIFWLFCPAAQGQTNACEGSSVVFSSGVEAFQFQWQSSTDDIWSALEEGAPYFGTASNALGIAPVEPGMNGTSFRCLVPAFGNEIPDSIVYLTTLNVIESLEASEIDLAPGSSALANCNDDNAITLIQSEQATGSSGPINTVWQIATGATWTTLAAEDSELILTNLTEPTFVRQVSQSSGDCPETVYSNVVEIDVFEPLTLPALLGEQQICIDTAPIALVYAAPSGGSGNYAFQWQSALGGQGWNDIQGATALVYAPNVLSESTSFRLIVSDVNDCGTMASNAVSIDVFLPLSAAIIALDPSSSLNNNCFADNEIAFTQTNPATGSNGTINTQWQQLAGDVWVTLAEPEETLELTNLIESTSFRQISTSSGPCGGTVFSNSIAIDIYDPVIAGLVSEHQTICHVAAPAPISATSATGGSSYFTYQWQSAIPGSSWADISNAEGLDYQPPPLTETTSFRLIVTDNEGCASVPSNVVDVFVYDPLGIADAQEAQTICFMTEPDPLTNSGADGGSSLYSYQWEQNSGGGWIDMNGESETSLNPGTMDSSASFRLRVSDNEGCGVVASTPVFVEVLNDFFPGSVDVTSYELCFGDGFTVNSSGGQGVDGNISDIWYVSTAGDSFEQDFTLSELQWTVENATVDYDVYLESTSNFGCGTVVSDIIHVEVLDSIVSSEIAFNDYNGINLCYAEEAPTANISSLTTGADGEWSYAWQQRGTTGSWEDSQLNTDDFVAGVVYDSLQIRVLGTSSFGCGSFESNVLLVPVWDEVISGNIASSPEETICHLTEGTPLEASPATGGAGIFALQWMAFEAASPYAIEGAQSLNHAPGILTDTTSYYLEYTNLNGCGSVVSNTIQVSVLDSIVSSEIAFNDYNGINLCYAEEAPTANISSLTTGADGEWSYAWQQRGTTGSWEDSQLNTDDFVAGVVYDSLQIRVLGTSSFGCGSFESNVLLVPVWDEVISGNIASSPEETICHLTEGTPLEASPATGGAGIFALQWMAFEAASPYAIEGAQSLNHAPGILTDTTSYYLEYTNLNGCGSVVSNTIQVSVLPALQTGSIAGWDGQTLCHGESVSLSVENVDDFPWLSHQWYATDTSDVQAALVNFEELLFSSLSLTESTTFMLETTSDFGCGSIESESLEVNMWQALEAPEIDFEEGFQENTLCYLDIAPDFAVSSPAFGGGGPLVYEWELQQGTSGGFQGSGVFSEGYYNPGLLSDTVKVQLRVTDQYGCGTLLSNSLDLNVYAPLAITTQPQGQPICFGASPIDLASGASGGGDNYTFQWFVSADNDSFSGLDNQWTTQVINLPLEHGRWFYLNVASNEECGVIQSDTVFIDVQEPMIPGSISLADNPICAEEQAVLFSTNPQGGFNNFEFDWHVNSDGTWEAQADDGASFVSTALFNNTAFYVAFSEICGTVYSDTLELVVNPLPIINSIVGESDPCYNSVNQEYRVPNWDWTMEYEWNVDVSFGEITSGETVDEILVNWGFLSGTTEVSVLVTDPETSCNDDLGFEVNIADVMAPPLSIVVKKPGINLLVSTDSTECAQYLWGVKDALTGEVAHFPELIDQYAYFDNLDTLNFFYFVEVVHDCGDGTSCPTVNYYNHDPFVGLNDLTKTTTKVFPNPSGGQFNVLSSQKIQSFNIFTSAGKVIRNSSILGMNAVSIELNDCPSGLYILELKLDGGSSETHRLIVD